MTAATTSDGFRPVAFDDFTDDTWLAISEHFRKRFAVHRRLRSLLKSNQAKEFAELALGISDAAGNYSASDHGLGPQILARTPSSEIVELAERINREPHGRNLAELVCASDIDYLKTSVGTEIGCLLRPDEMWVTNKRTVFVHLLDKEQNDWKAAEEAIDMFSSQEDLGDSYEFWKEWHPDIIHALQTTASSGRRELETHGLVTGIDRASILRNTCSRMQLRAPFMTGEAGSDAGLGRRTPHWATVKPQLTRLNSHPA